MACRAVIANGGITLRDGERVGPGKDIRLA
jgi:hypothetical protein